MKQQRALVILTACCLILAGCGVNKSIHIADGETVDGGQSTVNGSVHIGAGCEVRGTCQTVNGKVTVGTGSKVGGLRTVNGSVTIANDVAVDDDVGTVNGSIRLAENVLVDGDVGAVNGSIACGSGSTITDDVSTVNGSIHLARTEVGGNLTTVNGSVELTDHSRVAGDVIIKGKNRRGATKKTIDPPPCSAPRMRFSATFLGRIDGGAASSDRRTLRQVANASRIQMV